ncbi:MAG: hypothetical protein HY978_00530 [Candidatus Liptonbacteria bacterium]|nr:hypothetical protein [Candidatus Liptonbacteria bacterium]
MIYGIIGIVLVYILLVFVISRLVLPFYGFRKAPPSPLPDAIKIKVEELAAQSSDQLDFARKLYAFIRSGWGAARTKTIINLPLAFRKNLTAIWNQPGYAHCHTINHLYYSMLCASRWFDPGDVRIRYSFFNGVAHQYLQIRINGRWLDVDPSVTYLPLNFGERVRWFG